MSKMHVVKNNVKLLVENEPEVKDCYNFLITRYWEKFELADSLCDAKHCTPAETITRAFRSLVKAEIIQLSEITKQMRKEKRKEFYSHYAKEVSR